LKDKRYKKGPSRGLSMKLDATSFIPKTPLPATASAHMGGGILYINM